MEDKLGQKNTYMNYFKTDSIREADEQAEKNK